MFSFFYLLLVVLSYFAGSCGKTILPCDSGDSTTGWWSMELADPSKLTMFFTPSRPGRQRIQISKNGVVLDPHYAFTHEMFVVREVGPKDDGVYSALLDGVLTDVLTLMIQDCAEELHLDYGDTYEFRVRSYAYSLDFSPHWYPEEPAVLLWNRTGNPQAVEDGHMGRLVNNKRTWRIERLTQEHNGYYTFRNKNQGCMEKRKMIVTAQHQYFHKLNGEEFDFIVELDLEVLDMSYTPSNGGAERPVMQNGQMLSESEELFDGRIYWTVTAKILHVRIRELQPSDAGVFEFRDQQGNLALLVELDIPGSSHDIYVGVGIGFGVLLVLVVCCLCVRKHKNKRRKNNSVPLNDVAAAEAVSFTNDTTQPSTSAHPSSAHRQAYPAPLPSKQPGSSDHQPLASPVPESSSYAATTLYPQGPGSTDHLYQAPGPVESSPASGLPVFIHPMTHF